MFPECVHAIHIILARPNFLIGKANLLMAAKTSVGILNLSYLLRLTSFTKVRSVEVSF